MNNVSNLDDILLGSQSTPVEPSHQEPLENNAYETEENNEEPHAVDFQGSNYESEESEETEAQSTNEDEYGNQEPIENEGVRKRLAKLSQKHASETLALRNEIDLLKSQLTNREQQQFNAAERQGFEYDPNSADDWQVQLRSFIQSTVQSMGMEQARAQQAKIEAQEQARFESRFKSDMARFDDFEDVMTGIQSTITDNMVRATSDMENPAAFLYAAAKRAPQELERISKLPTAIAQVRAIGALESSLRKTTTGTKAPRPISPTKGDAALERPKAKQLDPNADGYIEKLIQQSENKKIQRYNNFGRRR